MKVELPMERAVTGYPDSMKGGVQMNASMRWVVSFLVAAAGCRGKTEVTTEPSSSASAPILLAPSADPSLAALSSARAANQGSPPAVGAPSQVALPGRGTVAAERVVVPGQATVTPGSVVVPGQATVTPGKVVVPGGATVSPGKVVVPGLGTVSHGGINGHGND
jgi:hypothetical protein